MTHRFSAVQEAIQAFAERENSVYGEMMTAFAQVQEQETRLHEIEDLMAQGQMGDNLMDEYGTIQEQFEAAGGYDYEFRIKQVLQGLGFDQSQWETPLRHLSGGQQTRALLARLLLEPRSPPERLWQEPLVSSQLLEYELWNRVHAYNLASQLGDEVDGLLMRVGMLEMTRLVLAKALEPLPIALRTLDSLHLATMDFVRAQGETVELASYDHRLVACAQAIGIPLTAAL